jgi:hypothetical protein
MGEPESFSSREMAVDNILRELPRDLPLKEAEVRAFIKASGVVRRVNTQPVDAPDSAARAMLRPFRYVISNKDLYALSTFFDLLKAIAAGAAGLASLPTPAGFKSLADALQGFYASFKAIYAKGARLTSVEFLIVLTLQDLQPTTADVVSETLRARGTEIQAEAIETFLSHHERKEARGFTLRLSDGSWRLDGI